MENSTLDASMRGIHSAWGPLSTEVITACRKHRKGLVKAPATEEWLGVDRVRPPIYPKMGDLTPVRAGYANSLMPLASHDQGLSLNNHCTLRGWPPTTPSMRAVRVSPSRL